MAKKNKGKVIKMLSPENYIRQKARTLPIWECRVNSGWKETNLAWVVVARKHTNDNITSGFFLVDLDCLGVKDSFTMFNASEYEYSEMLQNISQEMEFEKTPYDLAHNIVYAGLEFADEFGFKPAKEFTKTTQYILEEDNENIELIDIECGKDGKPMYTRGPNDSDARAKSIIAQLERTAGKGNFYFIDEIGQPDNDWDDNEEEEEEDWDEEDEDEDGEDWEDEGEDEEDWDYDDEDLDDLSDDDDFLNVIQSLNIKMQKLDEEFSNLTAGETIKILKDIIPRADISNEEEKIKIVFLLNKIKSMLVNVNDVDELSDEFELQLEKYEIVKEAIPEFVCVDPGSSINIKAIVKDFNRLHHLSFNNPDAARKLLKKMRGKYPNNPAIHYMELVILFSADDLDLFRKKVEENYKRFPDYPLIRIMHDLFLSDAPTTKELLKEGFDRYFSGREKIHDIEVFQYFLTMVSIAFLERDITSIEAISEISQMLTIEPKLADLLVKKINTLKIDLLFKYEVK